jgi:hypothetical protein
MAIRRALIDAEQACSEARSSLQQWAQDRSQHSTDAELPSPRRSVESMLTSALDRMAFDWRPYYEAEFSKLLTYIRALEDRCRSSS